jgi:hypothetical protein
MNTRRYPRSTLEAFGVDARTACAIERPQPRERIAGALLAWAIGVLLAAAAVAWATEPEVAAAPVSACEQNGAARELADGKIQCLDKRGRKVGAPK